jgi:hypothetical protein
MPDEEQFPATLRFDFREVAGLLSLSIDDRTLGDALSDARRKEDGYRFHDALHVALAVRLGWSPVLRGMLGRKRRSDVETDRCEDGGRACMVEEAVCHLIHVHRVDAAHPKGMADLVRLIRRITEGFEVQTCSSADWTDAVALGLASIGRLFEDSGGAFEANFHDGTIRFLEAA